jgi:hypothetical protein
MVALAMAILPWRATPVNRQGFGGSKRTDGESS